MILTDNETKLDFLNNEAIATTVVRLLRDRPDHAVTIGVHGDWGAGKSSVLEMIEVALEGDERVLCLKFNGWRFQGFEDAKIALIEGIVTGLIEKRPALTKAAEAVKGVFRRIDWLKVAKKAGGLALTTFTGIPTLGQIETVVGGIERLLQDPAKLATKANLDAATEAARSLLKPADESKNVPEEIAGFRKAFDDLLKAADVDQLVVLIDDLDRCLPDTAIETLEAVRLFVFTPRTAFVVAADEAMIEYAVRKHFPDLPDTTGPRDYARNYLEKLIQVPIRIPALGETETRIFVTLLLVGAELGEDDLEFHALIADARERLRRPWQSTALDPSTVRTLLGVKAPRVSEALTISDQIGPILASGTQGNPRQIKRFLNALLLRQRTADARGFGDDVLLPVLAKLMLAERFMPRLFDQIATAAAANPKGACDELAALEADVGSATSETSQPSKGRAGPKPSTETKGGKLELVPAPEAGAAQSEWSASQAIVAWAQVRPPLAGIDLRPYLFVAKDRKDYFGSATALGHLSAVVERLMGKKFQVQTQETELRRLVQAEAGQVFEALRTRVLGSGKFDVAPDGVDGLTLLAKVHASLEPSLLDFLEQLPTDRLGAWVVKGWSESIKTADGRSRFDGLLERWKGSKSQLLSAAAAAAAKAKGPK
jgi:KAP family P-loop domain